MLKLENWLRFNPEDLKLVWTEMMCMRLYLWRRFVPTIGMLPGSKNPRFFWGKDQKIPWKFTQILQPHSKKTQIPTLELEELFFPGGGGRLKTRTCFPTSFPYNNPFLLFFSPSAPTFGNSTHWQSWLLPRQLEAAPGLKAVGDGESCPAFFIWDVPFPLGKFWDGFNVWEFSWFMRFFLRTEDNFKQFL